MKDKKIFKSDKFLICGAKGMVGSAIHRKLRNNGYGIEEKAEIFAPSRSEIDFTDSHEVKNWFNQNKPDIVIIAAAKVGGILANNSFPFEFLLENLKIQNNIIESAWQSRVRRVLFLGSSCIYPKLSKQPIKEEYLLTSQLEKSNQCYAVAKIAGLKLCEALNKEYKFDTISLMPSNLYGEGDNYEKVNSHVIPSLIRRFHEAKTASEKFVTCWGSGSPLREFLHVDDLAEASIFALENWDTFSKNSPIDNEGNPLYWMNVGSNDEISIKGLADKIAKVIGYKGEIKWDNSKPDGTPRKKLDTSKLTEMGWTSKINLDEGLKKTYASFLKDIDSGILRT